MNENEELDVLIDLLKHAKKLYPETGFINIHLGIIPEIMLEPEYFDRCFGEAGKVYTESEKYIHKVANYNGVHFVTLFDKKKEVKNNDCAA